MPARWTKDEENLRYKELHKLYIKENKSLKEVSKILKIGKSAVYSRLLRLRIKTCRALKEGFNNSRNDVVIPHQYSKDLAEFIGVMLGDGCINRWQVMVTLGTKELVYVNYVAELMKTLFRVNPKILVRKDGYRVVYFGSIEAIRWLMSQGLVHNKVKSQVAIPTWIFARKNFMNRFLKGFFDTDGSVYRLRFGVQLAFTNKSLPLLEGIGKCLRLNGYFPSKISRYKIYVTRKEDVLRFFKEICPANIKHRLRFDKFVHYYD